MRAAQTQSFFGMSSWRAGLGRRRRTSENCDESFSKQFSKSRLMGAYNHLKHHVPQNLSLSCSCASTVERCKWEFGFIIARVSLVLLHLPSSSLHVEIVRNNFPWAFSITRNRSLWAKQAAESATSTFGFTSRCLIKISKVNGEKWKVPTRLMSFFCIGFRYRADGTVSARGKANGSDYKYPLSLQSRPWWRWKKVVGARHGREWK